MSYADKADQRRADLAYYHRNADAILERRRRRRALLSFEKERKRKDQVLADEISARRVLSQKRKEQRRRNLELLAKGEHFKYLRQYCVEGVYGSGPYWRDVYLAIRKDGSLGREFDLYAEATSLVTCQLCGKKSTPKKISYRSGCSRWNRRPDDYVTPSKDILCMGCWNKIRPIVRKQNEVEECERLLKKLKQQITVANRIERENDSRRIESTA